MWVCVGFEMSCAALFLLPLTVDTRLETLRTFQRDFPGTCGVGKQEGQGTCSWLAPCTRQSWFGCLAPR